MAESDDLETLDLTLLDLVDHVLNKGVVLAGEATISVAGIDLIYLGLNVVLGSVGTIESILERRQMLPAATPPSPAARGGED